MLKGCKHLESLSILFRGVKCDAIYLISSQLFLPSTLKILKLREVRESVVIRLLKRGSNDDRLLESISGLSGASSSQPLCMLRNLSLVLDVISDELIRCLYNALPLLVELNLKDRPSQQPSLPRDLSNNGLLLLSLCEHLTTLSLVRSRLNHPASFEHVNDMGILLFATNCNNGALESVTLGGFSAVTDAGFAAILNSCRSLKRFEVRNVPKFSDMTFLDRTSDPDSLVELRLLSCRRITSQAMEQLAPHAGLEVLDLSGCTNMTDMCISYLMCLRKLTSLNLAGIDVSDGGLGILGIVQSPIARLCLRGCKAITNRGISLLLKEGGISKTLTSLDIGHIPGISDKAVCMIAASAPKINELCLRYCSLVTDASVRILGSTRGWHQDRNMSYIQRLDLASCNVSIEILKLARQPLFPKLRWLGIRPAGYTFSASARGSVDLIRRQRPWLFICCDGHEMECHDEWHVHHENKLVELEEEFDDASEEESDDEWETDEE
ncbi:OLC1v1022338C2 [Oldenlandia corymbosa var. corymbosa]|nr:OLC1v1022338C2 [Oldenlandia corymbosa var. corymbosa]